MNILILNGNNQRAGFSHAITEAFAQGAATAGHIIETIHISDLKFDPVLQEGYHEIQPLEEDLLLFQQKVLWCQHLVIIYPTWWGGPPALLKGLFDRSFLPDFAFRYHEKGPWWDKLLKGRTAQLITTMDSPFLWYAIVYRSAGTHLLKQAILHYCGFKKVRTTCLDRMKFRNAQSLESFLDRIRKKAAKL